MTKKAYCLFNKATGNRLTHPRVGLWYTFNIEEAKEMHEACVSSMKSMGLEKLTENIVIVEDNTDNN